MYQGAPGAQGQHRVNQAAAIMLIYGLPVKSGGRMSARLVSPELSYLDRSGGQFASRYARTHD